MLWFGVDLVNSSAAVFSMEQWWKIWLLVIHMKSNEAQIFTITRWLSESHIHQILCHLGMYIGRYAFSFEGYRICQKSNNYWINQESLWLKGSWIHVYKWLRHLSLVLRWSRSMTRKEYNGIWLWSVLCTLLVLKDEDQDQDQTKVEDKV